MIRNTEGESGNNRWAIADFPQSVDYEADGCIFWTDARQQTDGLFRGGVHVVSIDDDPVDPAVFIPAKSLFSSLEEAQEDADAFAFEIAGDGRMRSEVLAKRK
ncbi:hypothetical protein A6P55_21010 [Pandoraea pnomenusa]|nr:hypothetical protein A6P55_21010 [Pandoraea pnomenusa]